MKAAPAHWSAIASLYGVVVSMLKLVLSVLMPQRLRCPGFHYQSEAALPRQLGLPILPAGSPIRPRIHSALRGEIAGPPGWRSSALETDRPCPVQFPDCFAPSRPLLPPAKNVLPTQRNCRVSRFAPASKRRTTQRPEAVR